MFQSVHRISLLEPTLPHLRRYGCELGCPKRGTVFQYVQGPTFGINIFLICEGTVRVGMAETGPSVPICPGGPIFGIVISLIAKVQCDFSSSKLEMFGFVQMDASWWPPDCLHTPSHCTRLIKSQVCKVQTFHICS